MNSRRLVAWVWAVTTCAGLLCAGAWAAPSAGVGGGQAQTQAGKPQNGRATQGQASGTVRGAVLRSSKGAVAPGAGGAALATTLLKWTGEQLAQDAFGLGFDRVMEAIGLGGGSDPKLDEILGKLDAMDKKLDHITAEIADMRDALSAQITSLGCKLSAENQSIAARPDVKNITSDWEEFQLLPAEKINRTAKAAQLAEWILGAHNIPAAMEGIHEALTGGIGTDSGALVPWTAVLVDGIKTEHKDLLSSYMVLERYFGDALGVETRGLVLIVEAKNLKDHQSKSVSPQKSGTLYREQIFLPKLQKQVETFLHCVDMLVAASGDPNAPGCGFVSNLDEATQVYARADAIAAQAGSLYVLTPKGKNSKPHHWGPHVHVIVGSKVASSAGMPLVLGNDGCLKQRTDATSTVAVNTYMDLVPKLSGAFNRDEIRRIVEPTCIRILPPAVPYSVTDSPHTEVARTHEARVYSYELQSDTRAGQPCHVEFALENLGMVFNDIIPVRFNVNFEPIPSGGSPLGELVIDYRQWDVCMKWDMWTGNSRVVGNVDDKYNWDKLPTTSPGHDRLTLANGIYSLLVFDPSAAGNVTLRYSVNQFGPGHSGYTVGIWPLRGTPFHRNVGDERLLPAMWNDQTLDFAFDPGAGPAMFYFMALGMPQHSQYITPRLVAR